MPVLPVSCRWRVSLSCLLADGVGLDEVIDYDLNRLFPASGPAFRASAIRRAAL
jgi:hypothetical protein